jgi:hypothetical protein
MSRISDRIRDPEKSQQVNHVKYHIIPTEDGEWRVKRTGAERADSVHETKDKAVDRARDLAKQLTVGQVIIHKKDGSIEAERTYRKDRLV